MVPRSEKGIFSYLKKKTPLCSLDFEEHGRNDWDIICPAPGFADGVSLIGTHSAELRFFVCSTQLSAEKCIPHQEFSQKSTVKQHLLNL